MTVEEMLNSVRELRILKFELDECFVGFEKGAHDSLSRMRDITARMQTLAASLNDWGG